MSEDYTYSWDEGPIEDVKENEFVLLPPGEYPFTVLKFERGRHEPRGGGKLPACPKAIIHCEIDGGRLGSAIVKNNLFLHSRCQGLIAEFFRSIGLRKHGEPLLMAWDQIVGRTGRCKIEHRQGSDGNTYHDLKKFLDPPVGGQPAPPPQQQEQTPAVDADYGDVPF